MFSVFDCRLQTPDSRLLMKKWRNAILGLLLVLLGVGTTSIVLIARRGGDWRLANIAAIASLIIVLLILILVVPPLARSARAEVSGLDLPVQLTKGGVIFIGVLGVVAFAAWNTGNNLLFLVFSLLASTLFVSWIAARASLRRCARRSECNDTHTLAPTPPRGRRPKPLRLRSLIGASPSGRMIAVK